MRSGSTRTSGACSVCWAATLCTASEIADDEVVAAVHTVEAGHAHHQVVLLHRHRPARPVGRDLAGDAVDLRFVHVAEPEFDLGAEVVAHARLQLGPARSGDHRVHAELRAPARRGPAPPARGRGTPRRMPANRRSPGTRRRTGRRPRDGSDRRASADMPPSSRRGLLEHAFPLTQNGFHLCDHTVDPVGF